MNKGLVWLLMGDVRWWLRIALVVFYRTPPICPPRSPSPWPSPAERERGYPPPHHRFALI